METFIGKQKVNACFTATKPSQQIKRMLLSGPIQRFPSHILGFSSIQETLLQQLQFHWKFCVDSLFRSA